MRPNVRQALRRFPLRDRPRLLRVAVVLIVSAAGLVMGTMPDPTRSTAAEAVTSGAWPVKGVYDSSSRALELASSHLELSAAWSQPSAARLTVRLPEDSTPLIADASTWLILRDGSLLDLSTEARPAGPMRLQPIAEPGLGPGLRAEGELWVERLDLAVRVELVLFENGPYFTSRLIPPPGSDAIAGAVYLDGRVFPASSPASVAYIADDDQLQEGTVPAEEVEISIGHGKPLLLREASAPRGILMALLDPSDSPSSVRASALDAGIAFRWRHRHIGGGRPGLSPDLPRLYVHLVDTRDLSAALDPYRSLIRDLYPPAPVPPWFRQQWISWYLYGMDVDEARLKAQIDHIADNLNDLGPWSILVDAGWYVAEGRPDSDWRRVDETKFPSGLRSLVDYAHERGVRVVLYLSGSYLDDRADTGNWLGLRGIAERHPEWLVDIENGDPWHSYYYDYSHPGFQEYLRRVLHDYFVTYGVDGIKVDGLQDTRFAVERGVERGLYSPDERPIVPTASLYALIYREASALRPDVYLEAGWRMPAFSAPHFTVARQSDDTPDFDSGFPAPGLRDHVDYAIAQRLLLDQRPHLGNFWGDPNEDPIGLRWLEAGLALSSPVALGFDLRSMAPETLSDYRARLAQLRPFRGDVRIPGGLHSNSFSSTVDGITFIALFNRGNDAREMVAELADHGLASGARIAGYDVAADRPFSVRGSLSTTVGPRDLRLFALRADPGVLWTDSGHRVAASRSGLSLEMTGPEGLGGYAYVATPRPRAILIDGEPLPPDRWSYDDESGVLRLEYGYGDDGTVSIEIGY